MQTLSAKKFLFDMDGTIVNSHAVVEKVLKDFCQKYNLNFADAIAYSHGRRSQDTIIHFIGDNDNARKELELFDQAELETTEGIIAIAGAQDFLASININDWALVTSAGRELAIKRMRAANLPLPNVMVCAEDIKNGKPSPDCYLLAANKLNQAITDCIVFEDALAGINAGLSSGAKVIAINNYCDASSLAAYQVDCFAQIKLSKNNEQYIITFPKK